jgi:hypothetical protein
MRQCRLSRTSERVDTWAPAAGRVGTPQQISALSREFEGIVAVSFLLLDASVLRKFTGRQVGVGDYLFLACFITTIAMIGGAFGTSLEADEKVSDAAYGRRQRERQRRLRLGPDTTHG